jgi:hypothetical protein
MNKKEHYLPADVGLWLCWQTVVPMVETLGIAFVVLKDWQIFLL